MNPYNVYPNPSNDFTAIDVEYADAAQNICQVGLAVVREGRVVETRSWNICPPGNHYEKKQQETHHMSPADTANAPTFVQAWPEIEPYLRDEELWAHNAGSAENKVLDKNLRRWEIEAGPYEVLDSMRLFIRPDRDQWNSGNGLRACLYAMGLPCENHHDAGADAEMCAELLLAYLRGVQPDWERSDALMAQYEMNKHPQKKRVVLHMGEFQEYNERIEAIKEKEKEAAKVRAAALRGSGDGMLNLFGEPEPAEDAATEIGDGSTGTSGEIGDGAVGNGGDTAPALTDEEEELLHRTDVFAEIASTRDDAPLQLVDVWDKGDAKPAEGRKRVDFYRLSSGADGPLSGKKVAITGAFCIGRKEIQRALEAMGAKSTSSVAKTTGAILIGSHGVGLPKLAAVEKLLKNGYVVPRIVGDDDFHEFLYGDAGVFHLGDGDAPRKQLDLTYKHFEENCWPMTFPLSSIANKELFVPLDIAGDRRLFVQMCGNVGAFANEEMDEMTQVIVLPDDTLECLRRGEKDDRIRAVEQFYNGLRAVTFELQFLPLSDILRFLCQRIVRCGDDVTGRLYTAYLRSAGIDPEADEHFGLAAERLRYEQERQAAEQA